MRILKPVLLSALIVVLCLFIAPMTYADTNVTNETSLNQEQKEIIEIFSKLGEQAAKSNLPTHNDQAQTIESFSTSSDNNETRASLESQLAELGVKEISQEEVNRQFGDPNNSPNYPSIALPPSTSSVKWYSKSSTLNKNGKTYVIQMLFAQGLNPDSNLYSAVNNAVLYSDQSVIAKNVRYLVQMYAQKAIGLIPVVQWTPYELLFGDAAQATNNDYLITHRESTTMIYSYVRESTQSANSFKNTYVSNMISVASTHTLAYYDKAANKPKTKSTDFATTTYDENFGNTSKAVDSFISGIKGVSNITSFTFYNHDKTKSLTYPISTPLTIIQVR